MGAVLGSSSLLAARLAEHQPDGAERLAAAAQSARVQEPDAAGVDEARRLARAQGAREGEEMNAPALIVARQMEDVVLVKLDAAQAALSECKTVMEVKHIADVVEAARVYLQRTHASVETVDRANEVKTLAEKQMGAFLAEMPSAAGRPKISQDARLISKLATLSDLGITKDQSARSQKLAAIPEPEFRKRIETLKATGESPTPAKVLANGSAQRSPQLKSRDFRRDGRRMSVVTELTTDRSIALAEKALWRLSVVASQAENVSRAINEVNMASAFCVMTPDVVDDLIRQFSNAKRAINEMIGTLRRKKNENESVSV